MLGGREGGGGWGLAEPRTWVLGVGDAVGRGPDQQRERGRGARNARLKLITAYSDRCAVWVVLLGGREGEGGGAGWGCHTTINRKRRGRWPTKLAVA